MIELSKVTCPVLAVMRRAAGISKEIPSKPEEKVPEKRDRDSLAGHYVEPRDTPGQKSLKAYWRI